MEANNMSAWLRFATDDRQFNKNGSNRITKQPHSLSSIHQAKQSRLVSRDKQTATNHTLTNNPQSLPLYVRTNVRTFIHPSIHPFKPSMHTYVHTLHSTLNTRTFIHTRYTRSFRPSYRRVCQCRGTQQKGNRMCYQLIFQLVYWNRCIEMIKYLYDISSIQLLHSEKFISFHYTSD